MHQISAITFKKMYQKNKRILEDNFLNKIYFEIDINASKYANRKTKAYLYDHFFCIVRTSSSSSLAQQPMSVKACLYPLVGFGFQ